MANTTRWYSTLPVWPVGACPNSKVAGESAAGRWRALPLVDGQDPPEDPRPIERAASELPLYDWWIAIDPWSTWALLERCGGLVPARLTIGAVGAATRWLLAEYGLHPAVATESAAALRESITPRIGRQERLLVPTGAASRALAEPFGALGAEVASPVAHSPRLPRAAAAELAAIARCDVPPTVVLGDPAATAALLRHAPELIGSIDARTIGVAPGEPLAPHGIATETIPSDGASIASYFRAAPGA